MDLLKESNNLAALFINKLLKENKNTNLVGVYFSDFTLFQDGNAKIYNALAKSLGNNLFIGVYQDEDASEEEFSFEQKQKIIESFGIDKSKIVQETHETIPAETLKKFNGNNTAFIVFVTEDTAMWLGDSDYYTEYTSDTTALSYDKKGYFMIVPDVHTQLGSQNLSNNEIVQIIKSDKTSDKLKSAIIKKIYKSDATIAALTGTSAKSNSKDTSDQPPVPGSAGRTGGSSPSASAKGKTPNTPKISGEKSKVHPMKQKILNPDTGKEIKVQSALKYPRWKPVYKQAEKILKSHGIDRADRTEKPRVNKTWNNRNLIPSYRKRKEKKDESANPTLKKK